jgi:hypothetical protein
MYPHFLSHIRTRRLRPLIPYVSNHAFLGTAANPHGRIAKEMSMRNLQDKPIRISRVTNESDVEASKTLLTQEKTSKENTNYASSDKDALDTKQASDGLNSHKDSSDTLRDGSGVNLEPSKDAHGRHATQRPLRAATTNMPDNSIQDVRNGQHWNVSRNITSIYSFTPPPPHPNKSHTPRVFHFVWVSPGLREPYEVPKELERLVTGWREMNPAWNATIWTNTLIREHFPDLANNVLKHLNYSAWIADLARYAILHRYGGFYLDADTHPVHPLGDFVAQYSPFTVCQGYNDDVGRPFVPFQDRDKCRRFANGIIATPPDHISMKTMFERAVNRTIEFGLGRPTDKGEGGKKSEGFHSGLTGPYLWKTVIRPDRSFTVLSMKTFLPCGFRNAARVRSCYVKYYVDDPLVYGMHRLTMT